jgi:hypothetical protein
MIDKFSQALTLMREAFQDAQAGSGSLASLDLAGEVDGAQKVINGVPRTLEPGLSR